MKDLRVRSNEGGMMSRFLWLLGLAGVATCIAWGVSIADAANSPTFRDCSFAGGIDPDFVRLSGATVGPGGTLSAQSTQTVRLEASESSDPGDSNGHDTFMATVTAPGAPSRTVSGAGTGKVFLTLPLAGSPSGRTNTISWAATFDNGGHHCPSSQTPQNTGPNPFVVQVTGPTTCVVPKLRGKTLEAAKATLKRFDCTLGKVRRRGKMARRVRKQHPAPGTTLPAGGKVNVALGPRSGR